MQMRFLGGGSGYAIHLVDGKEVYDKSKDNDLPYEVEHMYPDYSLYPSETGFYKPLKEQKCFGFLSRGCPRGCEFCHVACKEGKKSYKVADLENFWKGQGNIVLCDPNILACKEWENLLTQLADSKALVDFNQGIGVRLATEEKIDILNKVRTSNIHLAWDKMDKDLTEDFKRFKKYFKRKTGTMVYVLVNFGTSIEEDLYRFYTLRDLGFGPYCMVYDKQHADDVYRDMQRWVNHKAIFKTVKRFEDYKS